jgi:hypothetical protein
MNFVKFERKKNRPDKTEKSLCIQLPNPPVYFSVFKSTVVHAILYFLKMFAKTFETVGKYLISNTPI